ncbi:MAG TPA: peroxiredoxin [Caulobacteraceae bacterium]
MKKLLACAVSLAVLAAAPAYAALQPGAKAPDFTAPGAMAGKAFTFSLKEALKHGPVVLYFYPAAFTSGCTVEAHDFAEAADQYKALGATLIGVTAGNTDRLVEFSTSDCRSKFATAAVTKDIIKSYDTVLPQKPDWSNRTSYVIAPNGKIIFTYSDLDPSKHVEMTLDALKKWHDDHGK